MTTDEVALWEQQPTDTDQSYSAFCVYRDLGVRRSLVEASRKYYDLGDEPIAGTSPKLRQMKSWSATHNWVARANAYDLYLDEQARYEQLEAVKEMRRRHAAVASMALAKAAERLRVASSESLSISDASRLLDLAVKIERLARGEASERHELSGVNGGAITHDIGIRDEMFDKFKQMADRATKRLQDSEQPSDDVAEA